LARQHVVIEPNAGASFRHDRRERRLAHLELVAEALPPMAQVSERSRMFYARKKLAELISAP